MKIQILSFLTLFSLFIAGSCSDAIEFDSHDNLGPLSDEINFNVSTDWNETTNSRASADTDRILKDVIPLALENGKDSIYLHIFEESELKTTDSNTRGPFQKGLFSDMSVTGFKFNHSTGWDGTAAPDFMYNVKYQESDGYYKIPDGNEKYVWPNDNYDVRFYSVMPYGAGTLSSSSTKGEPTLTYSVPSSVISQNELFVGQSPIIHSDQQRRTPMKMEMERALASIRFEESDDLLEDMILSYIQISNVRYRGTYSFKSKTWDPNVYYTTEYSMYVDKKIPNGEGTPLTNAYQNIFLIPQSTLSNPINLSVSFTDSQASMDAFTLTTPLKMTFEAGKSYVLRISTSNVIVEDELIISAPDTLQLSTSNFSDLGELKIESRRLFKKKTDNTVLARMPLNYNLNYYEYNSATGEYDIPLDYEPSWLNLEENSSNDYWGDNYGDTNTGSTEYYLSYSTNASINYETQYNNKLKNAATKGSTAKPWNLANSTGGETNENTANCYIINSPGTYSIPLVFGNAIKNGSYNSDLHTNICNHNDPSQCKNPQVIHEYPITAIQWSESNYIKYNVDQPYIYNFKPSNMTIEEFLPSVDIRWQDKSNLITNVKFNADRTRIIFTVTKANIAQGNAYIVLKDAAEGDIWGWHIWVTPYQPGIEDKTVTDKNGKETIFMPYNLGWVDSSIRYPKQRVRLEVTQELSGKKADCILQCEELTRIKGSSVTWLQGYPFPCYSTRNIQDRDYWDDLITPGDTHDMRLCLLITFSMWNSSSGYIPYYYNLWDSGKTNGDISNWLKYEQTKNLYDPCPAGYQVSGLYAYTSFTNNELNANSLEYHNTNEKIDPGLTGAISYYCNPDKTGDVITFPTTDIVIDNRVVKQNKTLLLTPYASGEEYRTFTPCVNITNGCIKFNETDLSTGSKPVYLQIRPIREL